MFDPLSYFSFQPVIHDWCNKGRGVCYPVLLIGTSRPCGGFSLSLYEWRYVALLNQSAPTSDSFIGSAGRVLGQSNEESMGQISSMTVDLSVTNASTVLLSLLDLFRSH